MPLLLRLFTLFICYCQLATAAPANHAVVLLYHHISDDTPAATSTSPQQFAEHLAYLKQNDYQIWELERVVKHLQNKHALPDRVVSITFDDAYISVYTQAFPLLQHYAWPFTIFVNTEAIDKGYGLHASWQQLRTMAGKGANIANHSHSHRHLAQQANNESTEQWLQRVRRDIEIAQQRIKTETGQINPLFAYPYGESTTALRSIIDELGYIGFGQHSGPIGVNSDFSVLPRYPVAGAYADINSFKNKVSSIPMPVTSIRAPASPLPYNLSKPSLELTLQYPLKNFRCYGSRQGELQQRWLNKQQTKVAVTPTKAIPVGRSRYNCTANAVNNRFYWLSQPWIRLQENNQWLLD